MTHTPIIIKENSKYRIVKLWNDYFYEGKNIFGRWVIGRTIQETEIDATWAKLEDLAAK